MFVACNRAKASGNWRALYYIEDGVSCLAGLQAVCGRVLPKRSERGFCGRVFTLFRIGCWWNKGVYDVWFVTFPDQHCFPETWDILYIQHVSTLCSWGHLQLALGTSRSALGRKLQVAQCIRSVSRLSLFLSRCAYLHPAFRVFAMVCVHFCPKQRRSWVDRPYHPNPQWQIFPGGVLLASAFISLESLGSISCLWTCGWWIQEVGSFERDQKICSMCPSWATLADTSANVEWRNWTSFVSNPNHVLVARYTLATGLFRDINKCIRDDNEDGLRRLAWISVFLCRAPFSYACYIISHLDLVFDTRH